ncbi:hypothetical protein [Nonomuraea sp. NPDC049709]|uniref:hypothetical protein n=1 Tax=Nonomuraea sp. NPDC049709 TaxID=3154736 RepID=UPI003439C45F
MGRIEQAARVLGVTPSLREVANAVCRLADRKMPDPGPARRHSTLGYLCPIDYEQQAIDRVLPAA